MVVKTGGLDFWPPEFILAKIGIRDGGLGNR